MHPTELAQQLRNKYQLVCFEDLADVLLHHSTAFQLLKRLHKERYENSERLIFYTAYEPDQSQLDHLQRAASRIDISNFFIMVVCPYDIVEKLRSSNQKHGYDDSVIQNLVVPLNSTKTFGPSRLFPIESLCALPFMQTMIDSNGQVTPCCKIRHSIGDLNASGLDQIWMDPKIESIRQQMFAGHRPASCSVCWHNEDAGTTSLRQLAWHKYGSEFDLNGWSDDVQIRNITLSPTSLCNFTCRICDSHNSTSIAVEEMKFADDPQIIAKLKHMISIRNSPTITGKVLESLEALKHLDHIHVLGGEPLLWPGLPQLIDTVVANGNAHRITLAVNTNCSIYAEDKIKRMIENFHAVQILLSVDNVGKRFEIERGGTWSTIMDNIKKFASLQSEKCKVNFAVTVNLQNLLYLDEVQQFAKKLSVPILWWYLEDPDILCIDRATESVKMLVERKYKNHEDPELRSIAARVSASVGSDGQDFLAWCNKIDARRAQRFVDSHHEIYVAMGG